MPESIKKNSEFRKAYKNGKYKSGKYTTVYALFNNKEHNRVGIVTAKKVGNAVQRNRMRRLIREIYRHDIESMVNGYDIVFHVKPSVRVAVNSNRKLRAEFIPSYNELQKDILRIFQVMGFDQDKKDGILQ